MALGLLFLLLNVRAHAQEADAYKFQPPPPPPLNDTPDFDELDDDGFESDDEGFRPPPPPPMNVAPSSGNVVNEPISPSQNRPNNPPPPPTPAPDFRATNNAYISSPGKFRFKIVDGEFWQKGKKRTRGREIIGRSSN